MINDENLNKALQELQIRVKDNPADRAELNHIIFQILCYPSISEAEKHHMAHTMGVNDLIQKQRQLETEIRQKGSSSLGVCQCCGVLAQNEQLPYCTSFDDLKMGVGMHLYFRSLSYNALVFMLMFLIYSIYALVTNVQAYKTQTSSLQSLMCLLEDGGCGLADIGTGSKILREQPVTAIKYSVLIQSILGIVFVTLWSIMNVVKIHRQKAFIVEMESIRVSASDFTLMIQDFPKVYLQNTYQENLKEINEIFKRYEKQMHSIFSYEVVKINVARPLYLEHERNKKKKSDLKQELEGRQEVFRRWLEYRKDHSQFPIPESNRQVEYENYIKFFTTKYDVPTFHDTQLEEKNIVFVTFRSSKARQEIQKLNPLPSWKNLWNCCSDSTFPVKQVTISRAPEPQEIKWENVGFPKSTKTCRKVMIFFVTLLLIGISLGISIGVAFVNINNYIDQKDLQEYVPIVISLIVTLANVGIQMSIMYLSYLENEYITSVQQSNIALKVGLGQVLNSIGVPLVVSAVNANYQTKKFYAAGGLVEDVFWIALFSLFTPIGRLIDPFNIFLQIKRWYYEKPEERIKMFGQRELNQHYGNYDMDIGYEYAYIIKTSIFTAFFVPLQPIIAVFAPVGLIMYYLINKRNLFRHFQRPAYHEAYINNVVDMILLLSPIAFGFGHLTIINFIPDSNDDIQRLQETLVLNWITVIIGATFFFLVPLKIFYCCFDEPQFDHWDYLQKKPILQTDYDRLNPITKNQSIGEFQQYLNKLQEEKELPDQAEMIKFTVSNIRLKGGEQKHNRQFRSSSLIPHGDYMSPQYHQSLDHYKQFIHGNEMSNEQFK